MTTIAPSWCAYCKHFDGKASCRAFPAPNTIPYEVLHGSRHDTVAEGQTGDFVFTLRADKAAEMQSDLPYLP
jgi:hypothetical protein